MSKHDVLTPGDVIALHKIISAVNNGGTIARMDSDDVRRDGTVRRFAAESDGSGSLFGKDLRDVYLVVSDNITEYVWPVREIVKDMQIPRARVDPHGVTA